MSARNDIIPGTRFGRLTVLGKATNSAEQRSQAECRCDCGAVAIVTSKRLRHGNTRSCGCLQTDSRHTASLTHGHRKTRGGTTSPEYVTWCEIKTRCFNRHHHSFADYGGRGIVMSNRWREDFWAFYEDMGPCPPGYSIDRIDNDGPYCGPNDPQFPQYPHGNCRWATRLEQNRNRRSNRRLTFDGRTLCVAEWAEVLRVPRTRLKDRLRRGWSVERTLTTGVK